MNKTSVSGKSAGKQALLLGVESGSLGKKRVHFFIVNFPLNTYIYTYEEHQAANNIP